MPNVAITGAKGTVGNSLTAHLAPSYDIIPIDLPEIDILDQERLTRAMHSADVVIHLAGVFGRAVELKENWRSPHQDPKNRALFEAVLSTAQQLEVKQFIHASSIHVEDTLEFIQRDSGLLVATPRVFSTETKSGYGKAKRQQEEDLEQAASSFQNGAVSIRLGGVTVDNLPMQTHRDPSILQHEQKVWLEHKDLSNLVSLIMEVSTPNPYDVVYAVSNNNGRFHDTTNLYGWRAMANSASAI